jgi:hypothetical protein
LFTNDLDYKTNRQAIVPGEQQDTNQQQQPGQ